MPLMYELDPDARKCEPGPQDIYPEGAEQEHKESCDINKMIRNAAKGMQIPGSGKPLIFGEDDTTLDGITHRLKLQNAKEAMHDITTNQEFTEEELKLFSESIKKQFQFKTKTETKTETKSETKTETPSETKAP